MKQFVGPLLLSQGVRCWSVSQELRKDAPVRLGAKAEEIEAEFFRRLRDNHGLYELLQVLWGSLLIAAGALMARRQGELIELERGSFLDTSGTRLVFAARKRNSRNFRERRARPVPKVIADLLLKLQRMQEELLSLGVINEKCGLFAFPRVHSPGELKVVSDKSCNELLDRFCDYFETERTEDNRRYYIRQHQLRRFFAMLFFWGNSYSGLETLRWFLGHSDPEHLYRYITESTPGEVLKDVKVDFAIEQLRARHPSADQLAYAIQERFGVNMIELVDSEELPGYVESLLLDSKLHIEPHFFNGHNGREYTILIIVEECPR